MYKKQEIAPIKIIIAALSCFFLLKAFVFDLKQVNGHSMEPTIMPGQLVLINKMAYGIHLPFSNRYIMRWKKIRNDEIVALNHPLEKRLIIKRCVAISGEKFIITEHFLIIHSESIPAGNNNLLESLRFTTVPDDKILIIGDNHENSIDSRSFGFVSESSVLGKVIIL